MWLNVQRCRSSDRLSRVSLEYINNLTDRHMENTWLVHGNGKSAFVWHVQYFGERHGFGRLKPVLLIVLGVRRGVNHVESVCISCVSAGITLRLVKDTAVDENEITLGSGVQ